MIGAHLGRETLVIEHKEVRLRPDKHFSRQNSEDIIRHYIINRIWKPIINIALSELYEYIKAYIPKYLSGFWNNTGIEYGEFHIGVTDFGEIIGLPVTQMDIKENYHSIKIRIINQVRSTMAYNSTTTINSVMEKLQIEIIELEHDFDLMDDSYDQIIEESVRLTKIYQANEDKNNFLRDIWYHTMLRYKRTINKFANDPVIRKEIIHYIQNSDLVNDWIKIILISRLTHPVKLYYVEGEVMDRKLSPHDITYWIVEYRDFMCDELRAVRPAKKRMVRPSPPYFTLLQEYRPLVKKMVEDQVHMIMVKITFPGGKDAENWEPISYFDGKNMRSSIRTLDLNGEPCVIY